MGIIQSVWFDHNNPDFILIGSGRTSGIMKSTDRGQTWHDVLSQEKIPALGIPFISGSPILEQNGKRTFYAATGSSEVGFSIGIIKSSDDGETWDILPDFPLFADQKYNYVVRKVLAAPVRTSNTNPDIVYAIALNTFYKSLDGGVTWMSKVPQFNNADFDGTLDDMEVDPYNNDVIAISGLPAIGGVPKIWLSTDGGDSFIEIFTTCGYTYLNDVVNIQIDFPSSDRLYVLTREASRGGILYYDFSLLTPAWNTSNTINYKKYQLNPQFNRLFKVSQNLNYFYIGTDCFYISTPNALGYCISPYTVTSNYHPDARCVDAYGDIIMVGTDGGLLYSGDMGSTWSSINGFGKTGLTNNEVVGFDIVQGYDQRMVVGLIDNSFKIFLKNKWHSSTPLNYNTLAGTTWNSSTSNVGLGDVGSVAFTPSSKDVFWAINGGVVKTLINSSSFSSYQSPNYSCMINPPGHWWIIPIAINDKQPNQIFFGCFNGKILKSYGYEISNPCHTYAGGNWAQLPLAAADVNNIIISPSEPDIMYATTSGSTYSGTDCSKGIYRSADGGDNWTDITGGNCAAGSVQNSNYHISSVTVDWNNPNKVWVCMGGVSFNNTPPYLPYLENRVFRTDDATANPVIWVDMTGGPNGILPPLPTTAIVNQPGTSRVFLASDGGIFYCDDNDPDWNCFSNGLPITRITNLRIDHITNELYASTYGYGIWKTALPCDVAQQSFVIDQNTGNVTWSNTTFSAGDIIVKSGYKLTIDDHTRIFMDPNTSILVEKGAELVVDNATLTACEEMWQGIRVMGTYSLPQNTTNQGKVTLINGATIANARVGVETGKVRAAGGIIQAENAYFYNCEYGVKMHPYRNFMANNTSNTLPNLSYFEKCKFATTDDLKILSLIPRSHIWLNGIQRIRIEGNVFENTHPTVPAGPGRGKGIEATNSVFYVNELCSTTPCSNGIPNTFRNLHYGIYALATNSLTPMTVTNAIFDRNSFGTYLNGITQAKVTGCVYTVPPGITTSGRAYGLYLDHCTRYTIEENYFQNGTSLTNNTVGMIINNSGRYYNEVYNNFFNDLGYGMLSQHDNRGPGQGFGLQVKCNDFSEVNHIDLGISMSETHNGITGISVFQGGNASVTAPAGNTFTLTNSNNNYSHIFNNGLVVSKYFHHNIQGSTPTSSENWVPLNYNSPKVLLEEVPGEDYSKSQACPLHSSQTPPTSAQLYTELSIHEANVNSANLVLNIYRDGGIPELPEMVALAYPWETYYYFNTLMLESPYLSNQTLIAAIQNTDLLPDLLLKLVLIANPQCTRSGEVMGALEARDPQLPEYMMEEIMQVEDLPSPLEALEADVAYHNHLRYTTLNQIISLYLADSSTAVASDSLLQIFQRDPLIDLKYNEVFIHLQNENWEDAEGRLEALSQELVDCEYENQQYAEYTDFVPILIKMVRDSCEFWDLTTGEMDKLVELSDNGLYFPAAYARTIRLLYDSTYTYEEPIIFPVAQSARKGKAARPQLLSDAPVVQVYPNPARDYCIVDYQMDIMDVDASLHITTPQGKVVQQYTLYQPTGQKIIDIKGLADGLYYITLKTKRNLVVTRKITVAN